MDIDKSERQVWLYLKFPGPVEPSGNQPWQWKFDDDFPNYPRVI